LKHAPRKNTPTKTRARREEKERRIFAFIIFLAALFFSLLRLLRLPLKVRFRFNPPKNQSPKNSNNNARLLKEEEEEEEEEEESS